MDLLQNISLIVVIHIILIDLLLSADNAVVIALACRHLDPARRQQGIVWGTLGAISLRMLLIFVALSLLTVPGLRVIGGVLLFWIAIRLLQKPEPDHTRSVTGVVANASLLGAVKTIVVADFVMSLDNVLAISGAVHAGMQASSSQAQFAIVVIGLLISVPIMILASSLVLKLLESFPILVLAGVGLLGWIAGGMIVTDNLVLNQFGELSSLAKLLAQIVGAMAAIIIGRYWAGRKAQCQ
ncbi:TerC family protein [Orrella daihaiensis]|uniref:TerC family protein n=1 Tax=Orrella daihaiensis TaxID=2782176 RepID=A0ABY4AMV1_9BURK|nr:TerC family protein [Orrella daihaiensis]UOD51661.1 TerC family protein [Orrella daihaiensis]